MPKRNKTECRRWKVMAKLCANVEMAARRHKANCDEVERQSFFLQRQVELKEEKRLNEFRRLRAQSGSLSTNKEKAWAATNRQGGRMTNGEWWERHETKKKVAA
jgi:hypothetical protein